MMSTSDHLGLGLYSPAEAAFYARVSRQMMDRWVFGDAKGQAVVSRQLDEPGDKIVTFLDFVQTLAVREVRRRHGLPLQRIRQGIEEAARRYGLRYPLAQDHRIFLFSDQRGEGHGHLVIRLDQEADDVEERYAQLTGRDRRNYVLTPVVEMFLEDLSFDRETKLATRYRPMTHGAASVVLDPHRRFGEPVVEPGGYTVDALWHATNTEGGLREAADAYGVLVDEVVLANKYYDMLENRAS